MTNAERREATRKKVLDAAAVCFDQSGYLSTSLDDVLAGTQLTKGALYFHFGSKEALAAAVISAQEESWPAVIDEITSRPGTSLDHLVQLTYEISRTLRESQIIRAGLRLAVDGEVPGNDPARTFTRWTRIFEGLLRKAKRAADLNEDVAPATAARMIIGGFLGAYHLALVVDGTVDARKRLDEFWAITLPQLRP